MSHRLDRAVVPAGLIRSAKTYSLILGDGGLYVIHTGPAGRELYGKYKGISNIVLSVIEKKVEAGEAKITDENLKELASHAPGQFIPAGGFGPATVKKDWKGEVTLTITTPTKPLEFKFSSARMDEAEEFAKAVNA